MTTLIECHICDALHSQMRDHCPICGAKRVFLATHSFETQRTTCQYRSGERAQIELVRAYRTNLAHAFVTAQ